MGRVGIGSGAGRVGAGLSPLPPPDEAGGDQKNVRGWLGGPNGSPSASLVNALPLGRMMATCHSKRESVALSAR